MLAFGSHALKLEDSASEAVLAPSNCSWVMNPASNPALVVGTAEWLPDYMGKKIPLAGVAHRNGTLRFGIYPKTAVLDLNCKAHDLDNLYVVDSSGFVSSSAVNPTLTIVADALRVGKHILDRLR